MAADASLTERLQSFMRGDTAVADVLLREILPKLREIAVRTLNRERYIAPLTKTELISELWVSNLGKGGWEIHDRGHFYALASLAMRRILVEIARKRLAARRGGGVAALSLDEMGAFLGPSVQDAAQIVEMGILMDRLEAKDPDAARMVDMHYFSGFTLEEIALETQLTLKQVRSRWERGLKWLKRMLHAKARSNRSISRGPGI
jgi:RNA polymerase sigma factor (TIGR02999 family)